MTKQEYEARKEARKKAKEQNKQKLALSNYSPKQYINNMTRKRSFTWTEQDVDEPYVPAIPNNLNPPNATYKPTPKKKIKKDDPCERTPTKPQVVAGRKNTPASPEPSTSTGITHNRIPPYLYNFSSTPYPSKLAELSKELELSSSDDSDSDSSSSSSDSSDSDTDSNASDPLGAYLMQSPMISPLSTPFVLSPILPSFVPPQQRRIDGPRPLAVTIRIRPWRLHSTSRRLGDTRWVLKHDENDTMNNVHLFQFLYWHLFLTCISHIEFITLMYHI